jgi:hypothetical protein
VACEDWYPVSRDAPSTRSDSLFSPPVRKVQGRTSSESDDENDDFSKIFPKQSEYGESKKTLASQFDVDTRKKLAFEFSKYLRLLRVGLSKLYALMEIKWISSGVMDDVRAEDDYNTFSDTRDVCALVRCLALEQNTKLLVVINNQEVEVIFDTGSIFVAFGSLIHARAGYRFSNVRLHWYEDIHGNNRITGTTYHIASESISNIYRFFAFVLRNLNKANTKKENNKRKREAISERKTILRNLQLAGSEIYVFY